MDWQGLDDLFIIHNFFFFKGLFQVECLTNQHLLIPYKHDSHVTLEATKQAYELDTHDHFTYRYISCHSTFICFMFRPFKTLFKKVRDATMVKRNYMELNKIILIGWVDHALDHSLTPKKTCLDLMLQVYSPITPRQLTTWLNLRTLT